MSFISHLKKIDKCVNQIGDNIVCKIYEDEIDDKKFKKLWDTYRDHWVTSVETLYETKDILAEIESKYTVEMTDYYVHEDGWYVWVKGQDAPIITPLENIPTIEQQCYTLYGKTIRSIDEPTKYKNYVYKHNHTYIVGQDEWEMVKKLFPKNHDIHTIEYDNDVIISNSY